MKSLAAAVVALATLSTLAHAAPLKIAGLSCSAQPKSLANPDKHLSEVCLVTFKDEIKDVSSTGLMLKEGHNVTLYLLRSSGYNRDTRELSFDTYTYAAIDTTQGQVTPVDDYRMNPVSKTTVTLRKQDTAIAELKLDGVVQATAFDGKQLELTQ